ncbi:MAG: HEAT repeat domain-containing protein [Planctomycetota bacterium]
MHQALTGNPWPAAPGLQAALGDASIPWPVRATAARLLLKTPHPDSATLLLGAMRDPHPMVRAGAAYGAISQPGDEVLPALRALLKDPRRVARVMGAASLIIRGTPDDLPPAIAEIEAVITAVPDQLDMYRLLAMGYEKQGEWTKARTAHARVRAMVPREPAARAAQEAFEARAKAAGK